jgi:Putative beta-barrel porin-2, OmpL-like. bbp2
VSDWAAVQYLAYQFTPTLGGAARLEFFGDPQGWKTGFEGVYTALTAGVQYRPVKDVVIRPEVRFDYNGDGRPFEGKHGVFTAAVDVVVRW